MMIKTYKDLLAVVKWIADAPFLPPGVDIRIEEQDWLPSDVHEIRMSNPFHSDPHCDFYTIQFDTAAPETKESRKYVPHLLMEIMGCIEDMYDCSSGELKGA